MNVLDPGPGSWLQGRFLHLSKQEDNQSATGFPCGTSRGRDERPVPARGFRVRRCERRWFGGELARSPFG
ncbi:hypothetical protein SLNWT_3098 [Streptomyces albus]|uniref:Uncharacterized protein n=1 Tax=Streptomyces albus (strain ATCC 21838 / DSM 41398 / FERM P-419 / JCM 4703 / NBRC 107858) TaxID=1081613 RepID=A0A0B5EPI5_STRA4|nr:hypothetical protein SLNWT_3098 [Streptomyces albus]AOU77783.1 hypothetical protein SLNHY_3092 [Streptomyces albus]AYN33544.1 hypothetical protein DUI70_3043 [Streptomyces albus]